MKNRRETALRDELITAARYGRITPEEAEAKVREAGLSPLGKEPGAEEFDPMTESRWPLVMAIAWIAWRDVQLVKEQWAEYRSRCSHWIFREWKEPTEEGQSFEKRAGWFLEPLHGSTAVRLTMLDVLLRSESELPSSARFTPTQAERELWRALAEQRLTAEGFDRTGALIDIPAREWAHLKLYEKGEQDVLRYDALDATEAYSKVRFRREDLVSLWPRSESVDVNSLDLGSIGGQYLQPMATAASHVPLSVALCWVITQGGTASISVRDKEAWQLGVSKLLPRISDGSIEAIGRDQSQIGGVLPGVAFASIEVPWPVFQSMEQILGESETHIRCHLFAGSEEWKKDHNDQFFIKGGLRPQWTHLEVRRDHVLKLWPTPSTKSNSLKDCKLWLTEMMQASPTKRLKTKDECRKEARQKFGPIAIGQFQRIWAAAIEQTGATDWSKAGPRSSRSDRNGK
ncbi:MAG: hypothetical protein Q8S20_06215, partial [Sulfuritalea sp.]|nr:hypothetical protein [Sulfuritalea sp.]